MKTVNKVMQDAIHGNSGKIWNSENIGLPESFTPSNVKLDKGSGIHVEMGNLSGADVKLQCFDVESFKDMTIAFRNTYLEKAAKKFLQYDVSTKLRDIGNSEAMLQNERDSYDFDEETEEYSLKVDEEGKEIPFSDEGWHEFYINFAQELVYSEVYAPKTNKAAAAKAEAKAAALAQRKLDCEEQVKVTIQAVQDVSPDPLNEDQIEAFSEKVRKSWGF